MSDYLRFEADLKKVSRTLGIKLDKVVRKTSLDVLSGVVKKTPVDRGALRAAWQVGLNESPGEKATYKLNKKEKLTPRQAAQIALNKGSEVISKVTADDTVYISNYMPYAHVVEYGLYNPGPKTTSDGYSKKAPKGMARITLQEIEQKLIDELKNIKLL